MRDVVIGVDASTTAVKAIAFTADGTALAEGRAAYPLSTPRPGHAEQDAEDWWRALADALRQVAGAVAPARLAGMAITHQRETFVLVDEDGQALRPAILWLDERSRAEVAELSALFGREAIRDWSGKPPDPTPALYGLRWLALHEPRVMSRAACLLDTGAFLHLRLTGEKRSALGSADPLGLVDLRARAWRAELVEAAGLGPGQLPDIVLPGGGIGRVTEAAARACGLEPGLPVFAATGDGQANGLGLGVTDEGSACLSLGSGVVCGMYSERYAQSDAYRTLTAADGRGYMLETVLRSGMQLLEWVLRTTRAGSAAEMERAALTLAPGSDGLLLLPHFSGVMNPWWDEISRGAIVGLSLDHTPAHLYRAAVEAIALEQAVATEAMEDSLSVRAQRVVASGGGTNSSLVMRCLAAIMDRPIAISPVKEAAALGAAMLAATGAGWFPDAVQAARAMSARSEKVVEPDGELRAAYGPLREAYASLYPALRPISGALARLRDA